MNVKGFSTLHVAFVLLLVSVFSLHNQTAKAETLDQQVDRLKGEVAALSQELFEVQEATLYPDDTQVSLFLSLDASKNLVPETMEVSIDGRPVATHLYSSREKQALEDGSLQRLFVGNLALGEHRLGIKLTAQAQDRRFVRRETELRFQKRSGQTSIQLELGARAPDFEPTITLQDWQ